MRCVMLPQEVFAVIISIGGADHAMNVLARRLFWIGGKPSEVGGLLVIELDQDHRAVDAIVIDAARVRSADPGEPGLIEVAPDFVHFYSRVTIVDVADI